VLGGDYYEETVAHECSHAFQRKAFLGPRQRWHGKFFYTLLRSVCGFKNAGRCHTWSSSKAKALHFVLKQAGIISEAENHIPDLWRKPQVFTRAMYGQLTLNRESIAACKQQ
jgi:hypothetical protein